MPKFNDFSYESSRRERTAPAESPLVPNDISPLFDLEELEQATAHENTDQVTEPVKPRIAPDHPSMHRHTYDYDAGENAWNDLGGHEAEDLRIESMRAMVAAGMASIAVKRQVELIDQAEYAKTAHEYAKKIRQQTRELDARNGIDVNSADYLARERIDALRRSQKA